MVSFVLFPPGGVDIVPPLGVLEGSVLSPSLGVIGTDSSPDRSGVCAPTLVDEPAPLGSMLEFSYTLGTWSAVVFLPFVSENAKVIIFVFRHNFHFII